MPTTAFLPSNAVYSLNHYKHQDLLGVGSGPSGSGRLRASSGRSEAAA